ncbi:hypothetical protein HG536_0F04130 [Torulaspora globosa]|uniref:UDP-glucose:glycoprotein glucosyltransferase n=1 Tax=Torulaspora globosa TaxID=48254 RepID=A0A7G3ZKQ1_9SACH|nr:uncharacterized protein HG536_0F04130 [Torulaspora globosa]QLL34087.1 hypothetical protein HG536_0F04130 [Torulaspora globosa]
MLFWRLAVAVLVCVRYAASVNISGSAIGVPESVRIWSILQFLLRGDDRKILPELYPFVTQLEEFETENEQSDCDLVLRVSEMLATKYGLDDVGSLLPIYAELYPMGYPVRFSEASNENYFILNGKRYSKSDDVFYLQSKELQQQARVSDCEAAYDDEVIVGVNSQAPVVLLYGCPDDDGEFEEFNRNLYSEASNTGKLRYVWRSTCSLNEYSLKGVPLGLTKRSHSDPSVLPAELLGIPAEFAQAGLALGDLEVKKLADVDLKLASLIAAHQSGYKDFHRTLRYAKGIINNFPLLAEQLANLQMSTSKILESNEQLNRDGIDYNMLGLYINGQNWRLSEVDRYTLINAVSYEYYAMKHLGSILQKYEDVAGSLTAKRLLQVFAEISLPKLEQTQPIKVDLHRIPGFSEAVIYFNDIELDGQYEDMATNVRNFFEESKFGELPDVRQNWNEVIFAIDFGNLNDDNSKIALEGLNRAVKVIAQGYPQRIGLLPLNTAAGEGIIHKIYQLKHKDLSALAEFLENIPQNFITSRYEETPDYSSVVEELQIRETSIIINGNIYPFRKNTWHYLIAKTIKKDKAYLKGELAKIMSSEQGPTENIDVRSILHSRSANTRHQKYTPDYFADASYTSLDNTILRTIDESVVEIVKGEKYVTLHTVTLVDDFSTVIALRRLKNLLNTTFFGVRIRIINSGLPGKGRWNDIKKAVKSLDMAKLNSLILASQNRRALFASNHEALGKWLVDLPLEPITKGAFVVVNGRFIHLESDEVPTKHHFEAIIKREAQRTLDTMQALEQVLPDITKRSIDPDFIEMVSSILSKLFFHGTDIYNNGIDRTAEGTLSRVNLQLKLNDLTVFQSRDAPKPVDVTLFMDPTEERSQKLASLLLLLENVPFVNLQIVLLPTEELKISPIHRVYLDGTEDIELGRDLEHNFQVELDPPSHFFISNTSELDGIIVEAHVFKAGDTRSKANVDGLGGVCLELVGSDQRIEASCITMSTFGYCQFIVRSLQADYAVRSCDPRFRVASFAVNSRPDYVNSSSVALLHLDKVKLHVEVEETGVPAEPPQQQELNIYTVLKDNGHDEGKAQKMIETILAKAPKGETVNFWILDQPFLSRSFKQFCRQTTDDPSSPGSIQFIRYAWPAWLRPQRLCDKRLDLFKILFVDVMFSPAISRILYMDPEPTPLNPFELYSQSSGGSPLAMFEATGRGYWQEGYWAKKLAQTKKRFHTARLPFLVDLAQLRKTSGGDKLRIHYQRLSADIHSLAHAHEDLINDLQLEIPIETLTALPDVVIHDEL